jgi:hypothetical protein
MSARRRHKEEKREMLVISTYVSDENSETREVWYGCA